MKLLPLFTFCLLLVLLTLGCNSKHTILKPEPGFAKKNISDTLPKHHLTFPDDWLGKWSGNLSIYNSEGLKQIVPMSLDLARTDTVGIYTWAIIYIQDSIPQRRNYQLKEIDTSIGHYVIDEKNGILIDAFHIHNELTSIFDVMGNTLLTSYTLENNEMIFSVKMYPSKNIRVSGDTLVGTQAIPKVNSYQLALSQKARLHKNIVVKAGSIRN